MLPVHPSYLSCLFWCCGVVYPANSVAHAMHVHIHTNTNRSAEHRNKVINNCSKDYDNNNNLDSSNNCNYYDNKNNVESNNNTKTCRDRDRESERDRDKERQRDGGETEERQRQALTLSPSSKLTVTKVQKFFCAAERPCSSDTCRGRSFSS